MKRSFTLWIRCSINMRNGLIQPKKFRGGVRLHLLNLLLTSHVWRQDHNGFSHQDPGFLDIVANKKADVTRIYLPPDANTLLSVADHCLRSQQYVNVIVAGKQPPAVARHGCGDQALHDRHRHLGLGKQ